MLLPGSAELTRKLLAMAGPAWWFNFALRHKWWRARLFAAERYFLPGIFLHFFARKRLLDEIAQEALKAGCRQIVILGAGLDTLAWRLQAANPDILCIELDHPATQGAKTALRDASPKETPVLAPADLMHASPSSILSVIPGYDATQSTLFIAEGLLMYLPPARVSEIFRDLAAFAVPGSRFAFTWMEAHPNKPLAFHQSGRAIDWWLRWRREPFQWELPRAEVATFVETHGWHLSALSSPDELRRRFLLPHGLEKEPLAEGESVALLVKQA